MPSFLLNGRFFARFRDDDTVLVLQLGTISDRDTLMQLDPRTFFFTEHYRNYPAVLIRLAEVPRSLFEDVVREAWRHVAAMPSRSSKSLWRCPRCGHRFVTRNLWHACGRFPLARHFTGKPSVLRATFRRWAAIARACGPVTVYAQKTRIVIQARVRFAGAVVRGQWLDAGLWLKRRVRHPRVQRIEDFGRLGFGVHFRLTSPADIDRRLVAFMRAAYAEAVGGGAGGRR